MPEFAKSGKGQPCPVCDRTKDSDCRIREFGNIVLCHSYQEGKADEVVNGYRFLRTSSNGAGWGVWVWDAPKPLKPAKPAPKTRQEFVYSDRQGNPLVRVTRIEGENGKKEFYQSTWTGQAWISKLTDEARAAIPVYRYPEVREAIANGQPVFWVEGEGIANKLWEMGLAATTTLGGSKGFDKYGNYSQDLKGANLVICPDRDQLGMEYALQVEQAYPRAKWCYAFPKSPLWANIPQDGGLDMGDWIAEGATADAILAAVEPKRGAKPEQKPESPDFNQILNEVDLLEAAIANEAELEWELTNYAYENSLHQRGFTAAKLLRLARQRRDGGKELKVYSAKQIIERTTAPKMLVNALIPAGSSLLVGADGGLGKTTLFYNLARHISTGEPWSGYQVQKGKVLIVQADEPQSDIARKLRIGRYRELPNDDVDFIVDEWRFSQYRQLERLILDVGYVFVVIDSWTSTHAGMGIDLSKSYAGDNIYPLRDLANKTGCAIAIIHHLNKGGTMRDSSTLEGNVSEVWKITKGNPQDGFRPGERLLEVTKSRADLVGKYKLIQCPADYSWLHGGPIECPDSPEDAGLMLRIQNFLDSNPGYGYSALHVRDEFNVSFEKAEMELKRLERLGAIRGEWTIWNRPDGTQTGYWSYASLASDSEAIARQPVGAGVGGYSNPYYGDEF